MKIQFAGLRTCPVIPALAGAMLMTETAAVGQIQPDGYTCNADWARTNNLSTEITSRTPDCGGLAGGFAHWFDLSQDPDLASQYMTLRCVDFSLWSSSFAGDQEIFIRVYEDTTPGRAGQCPDQGFGNPDDPGPDIAGRVLLWEGSTVFPASSEGVDSTTTPRPDGDRSILVGDDSTGDGIPDGLLLQPDISFFVEVADTGEGVVRFGANTAGEVGDGEGPSSARVTWVRQPHCSGGGCATTGFGDYAKYNEWVPGFPDRDVVMQIHIDGGECTCPAPLRFCPTDITGPSGERDRQTDIADLLALLASWGQLAPPRPAGDVAPLPYGDNRVDTTDLLSLLAEWGRCPNPHGTCEGLADDLGNPSFVWEGSHTYRIDGVLDGPLRPPTNDFGDILSGPTECGWHDYGENGIPGGFRWGDAVGIEAATGVEGGDAWFLYFATCDGPKVISTQTLCEEGQIQDTILEVYRVGPCPASWTELIACDDSSASGCGDHARVEIDAADGEGFIIRIGGKFGEQGVGELHIEQKQSGTPDCNGNGILDTWDICPGPSVDCNRNLIPDECESIDCNGNGVPDECDIFFGASDDCDANGVPDECDPDCDDSGVPDTCESRIAVGSGPMSPFGTNAPQSVLFTDLPEAIGDVTFAFFASADLADATQAVDLHVDGYYVATVFANTGGDCTVPGDREDFIYRRALFNILYTLDGNTDALIELFPVGPIDETACGGSSFIEVSLKYPVAPTPQDIGTIEDCNGNGIWDFCDVGPGGGSSDVNGDGVPDECGMPAGRLGR